LAAGALATGARAEPQATPVCPAFTTAQLKQALGVKPLSVASNTADQANVPRLNCFYTLGEEPSLTFKVYAGAGELEKLESTIDVSLGTNNMNANQAATPCVPAKDGQCKGSLFNEHILPVAGFGPKAFDCPGGESAAALVVFTAKGDTFLVQSSGPYGIPGPNLSQVLAFARLVLHSGFSLG
jgi:hypothetical protein